MASHRPLPAVVTYEKVLTEFIAYHVSYLTFAVIALYNHLDALPAVMYAVDMLKKLSDVT